MKKELLIVIDGNALLHRAWHGVPPLTTPEGVVVNAVYGFTNVIERILGEYKPDYLAVAWDLPGKTFRHDLFEAYKGTRKEKEPELYAQIPMIQELLSLYHIPSLSVPGMEADDIIGTLAKTYGPDNGVHVRIITGDLDALQLISDDAVEVEFFVKGLSQTKIYNEEAVIDRYGLAPHQLIDLKTLMGDNSDNLPGIAGIGLKTATTLLREYDSLVKILEALERGELKKSIAAKFAGQEEQLKLMQKMVTIVTDVPMEFKLKEARVQAADAKALEQFFKQYGFRRWMEKYSGGKVTKPAQAKSKVAQTTLAELGTETVSITVTLKERDLFGSTVGAVYLFDGSSVCELRDPSDAVLKTLVAKLNTVGTLTCYDYKGLMHLLGAFRCKEVRDVVILDYIAESHARDVSFETILTKYAGLGEGASDAEFVQALHRAGAELVRLLQEREMFHVYTDIDFPVLPVLFDMEQAGILVNTKHLTDLSATFAVQIDKLTADIHKLAGKEFNIASPAQLAEVLFVDLNLDTKLIKKTKTGYSTAASELEKLWDLHAIIPLISEYREITKLKSTYVDTLPALVAKDGRIHTTYNPAIAATGRLSSVNPNLQNIPTRTELGREIRRAFIAKDGYKLVALDYSQIELRLAAAFAQDESFIDAFKRGLDIHAVTASQVLQKPVEEVSKAERSAAKAINFGILYGMGARNLARSTGFSQTEAKAFIDRYFELHTGIKDYMQRMKTFATEHGYVQTELGRRRYLPEIYSHVPMLKAAAERMAINMPIQGTQADLLKIAMIRVADWMRASNLDVTLLLQVHDELVFEIKDKDISECTAAIRDIMIGAWSGAVPLQVNVVNGSNWGDLA